MEHANLVFELGHHFENKMNILLHFNYALDRENKQEAFVSL